MGGLLSQPVTEVHSQCGDAGYGGVAPCVAEGQTDQPLLEAWAASSMQGWRQSMEDAHIADPEFGRGVSLFGVFDGHGGREVAQLCQDRLPMELRRQFAALQRCHKGEPCSDVDLWGTALTNTFLSLDASLASQETAQELARFKAPSSSRNGKEELVQRLRTAMVQKNMNGSARVPNHHELLAQMIVTRKWQQDKAKRQNTDLGSTQRDVGINSSAGGAPSPDTPEDDLASLAESGSGAEHVGTTAVCVVFSDTDIVCANAGDSRAILCRDGKCMDLSTDHKPSLPEERQRILAAGGTVDPQRVHGRVVWRVNQSLSLSRAIGDLAQKTNPALSPEEQAVTALPELIHAARSPKDEFIVMACDGIWDVMTSQQVADFVRQRLRKGSTPTEVSQALIANCLSPDPKETKGLGTDNMTCIIIVLKAPPKPSLANHFGLPAILTSHFGRASLCNAQTSTTKSCFREGSCERVARQERTKPQKNEATARSRRSF